MEKNPDRHDWMVFAFMLILVPLAGEPKFHPFSGDFSAFRVSFGSPVFLLFLLWLQHFPRMMLGCSAGIAVMLFRAGLDAAGGLPLPDALFIHIPNFFYYFAYALFFARPSLSRQTIYAQALAIAGWAVFAEVLASIAELAAMHALAFRDHYRLTVPMLLRLLGIAILRCFFILSFFFLFQLYNTEVQLRRKTKEKNRLSLLISGYTRKSSRCAVPCRVRKPLPAIAMRFMKRCGRAPKVPKMRSWPWKFCASPENVMKSRKIISAFSRACRNSPATATLTITSRRTGSPIS